MKKGLFICGMGRSGTTVLQHYVATKFDFSVTMETGLLKALFCHRGRNVNIDIIVPRLRRITNSLFFETEIPHKPHYILLKYIDIFRASAGQAESPFLDKDPSFIHHTKAIEVLEGVQFLVCIRNPIACFESRKRAKWSSHRGCFHNLFAVAFELYSAHSVRESSHVLIVHFENLVTNSASIDEALVKSGFHCRKAPVAVNLIDETERAWKKGVSDSFDSKKIDYWNSNMSSCERCFLEGFFWCLPFGQKYFRFRWNIVFWGGCITFLIFCRPLYYMFRLVKRFY